MAANRPEELLIILDYSASMNKQLNDKTRARYVLLSLYSALSTLPNDTKIGLRVFGPDNSYKSVISNDIHTNHDCTATYLRVPISSNNKQKIYAHLSEYKNPFGQTPIELSLQQAIQQDFSLSAYKHIILITDGTDTCGGNPCKYIKNIMQNRRDIVIDVISIADASGQYGNLSCLPRYTNGRYFVVKSSNEILSSFNLVLKENNLTLNQVPLKSNFNTEKKGQIRYSNYLFRVNY